MLLTELTEALVSFLNERSDQWSDGTIVAKAELDPELCLLRQLGVYIIPDFTQYNIEGSGTRGRRQRSSVNETLFCSVIVSKVFEQMREAGSDGVANWDEVKPLVETRQKVERILASYGSSSLTLTSMEPQPLVEEELDNRNFIAITTLGFEQTVCL